MTQREVFKELGQPEFYETEIDNWYILRFYPFVLGAMDAKVDMRNSMANDQNGRSGDRLTSIEWKSAFCLDTKENIHRLSH